MKSYLRSHIPITKPIVYVDLDGVLCNLKERVAEMKAKGVKEHELYSKVETFRDLPPISGAVEAFEELQNKFEVYILSTPPWSNPDVWAEKRRWVQDYLGKEAKKKLILSHNKGLMKGDYIIDDRDANGVADFEGEHIHFGSEKFPDWKSVLSYLNTKHD